MIFVHAVPLLPLSVHQREPENVALPVRYKWIVFRASVDEWTLTHQRHMTQTAAFHDGAEIGFIQHPSRALPTAQRHILKKEKKKSSKLCRRYFGMN